MKILFVVKQKRNVDAFLDTIRVLLERGHTVTLAVQEHLDARLNRYVAKIRSARFSLVPCPPLRNDRWAEVAPLLRSVRDCLQYQRPELRRAPKLQARTIDKLREDLHVGTGDEEMAAMLRAIPPEQIRHLDSIVKLAEERLPTDPLHDEFLRSERPDVVLVSPLVHFGSAQADMVASARAQGLPVGMLLFSWDNLSTKGRLHRPPDWMFVWNEQQRREAKDLHDFPEERVVVVGAPRFDSFFDLRHQMTREEFLRPLGLEPSNPTLLYVCSSAFVSASELAFVEKWRKALRSATSASVRSCNVIVRPHPDIALLDPGASVEELRWPSRKGIQAFIARPFDEPLAIVLRTSDRAQQGLYECIGHSVAVVGLNTSAELEAAIVGRPVYTVLADGADADGQSSTLHFHYLVQGGGGCVRVASSLQEHAAQLAAELKTPADAAELRGFVGDFLRPLGVDRPVSPLLAEAIERTFGADQIGAGHSVAPDAATETVATAIPEIDEQHTERPTEVRSFVFGRDRLSVQLLEQASSGGRHKFDKATIQWLQKYIRAGDVLCDVDAGVGLYSIFAAKHRGALVIACEPGYAAYTQLCDNLLLNGCDGSVIPVPLALSDFEGAGELKFPSNRAGGQWHTLRKASWRPKRSARDGRPSVRPVCVASLDSALRRYEWPVPQHVRLGETAPGLAVLAGAAKLLAKSALRTIFLTLADDDCGKLTSLVASTGWHIVGTTPISRGRVHVLLSNDETVAT